VFSPDNNERFYSKSLASGGYQVAMEEDRGGYEFSPAVVYSWLPRRFETRDISFGLSAGLGFETSRPLVLLGVHVGFNRNVSLLGGILMKQVTTLSGKYSTSPPSTLTENLSSDQLQTLVYKGNWFVALCFRFDTAPFGSNGKTGGSGSDGK
jgi:hypothetical protein